MSRRYVPDPDAVITAVARRLDGLEVEYRGTDRDVTALGRGVATLTAEVRRLADGPAGSTTAAKKVDGEPAEQPDWLTVPDVETARRWLTELDEWIGTVLRRHGVTVTTACWPLHPDVVAQLLALRVERDCAYGGERPTPVSEWLTRWLPGAAARIDTGLAACVTERGHRDGGRTYDATGLDLASVASWWRMDRHRPAADALALRPLS